MRKGRGSEWSSARRSIFQRPPRVPNATACLKLPIKLPIFGRSFCAFWSATGRFEALTILIAWIGISQNAIMHGQVAKARSTFIICKHKPHASPITALETVFQSKYCCIKCLMPRCFLLDRTIETSRVSWNYDCIQRVTLWYILIDGPMIHGSIVLSALLFLGLGRRA